MNYNLINIPVYGCIYTNLKYDIINSAKNTILTLNELKYSSGKVDKINMMDYGIGYYYNPTVIDFVKSFILGLYSIRNCSYTIDINNPFNSIANGRKLNIALKYRLENILNMTKAENMLYNLFFSRLFNKIYRQWNKDNKYSSRIEHRKLVYQSITPIDDRFYIADFVFKVPGYLPLIIELDGKYHENIEQQCYDIERTLNISSTFGYSILRIKNEELIFPEKVIHKILDSVNHEDKTEFSRSFNEIKCNNVEFIYKLIDLALSKKYYMYIISRVDNIFIIKCYHRIADTTDISKLSLKDFICKTFKDDKFVTSQQIISYSKHLKLI